MTFFVPSFLSFFSSFCFFSHVIMLVRFLFRIFFSSTLHLVLPWLLVSKSSKQLPASLSICWVGMEASFVLLAWILVRGSRRIPVSLVQAGWCDRKKSRVSKLLTKAEVYLKSSSLEGNPVRNVLVPQAVWSATRPMCLFTGIWGWRLGMRALPSDDKTLRLCTQGEPSTSCLCK